MTLAAGTKLGRYEIRSKLGEGGMGEVYLALDTELDRTVAIKILPEALASNEQRLRRFIQEAKAVSALNHPHILTIHEIGNTDSTRFIATEFIDGETLRDRIRRGSQKLHDVLEFAVQTTSAVAAAHAAGIIHRDIKPENIMIRRDGYVKVLDFGLAKLTEPTPASSDSDALTKALVKTREGVVMGTASYMSPEQAKGIYLDARTDLWSLGVVLYEMIAGRGPFVGDTAADSISLILQQDPAPLTRYAPETPSELERIIKKALTKDREERYQTAKDLLIDLRSLKRRLEVDAELNRSISTASATVNSTASASSAEYIFSGIKRHKIATVTALVLLAAAVGIGIYFRTKTSEVAIDSVAVLPFLNRSAEPDTEYLSDGLTESLIYRLSQLPNLKVSPTSSVFSYKNKEIDPVTIGNQLGVSAVLSGRIVQRGDSLTISAELVDVRQNKLLWGEQYERKMSEVLQTQREIARQIVDKLKVKVSGEETGLAKHYTENNEAYQLHLRGRYYWNKRSPESLHKAAGYFQQAIEKDPTFALAYAGMADTYALLGGPEAGGDMYPNEAFPKAKAAALKALEIDETLAEGHVPLAHVKCYFDRDFAGAEREYKRAIELNPNYSVAHHWYAIYFSVLGRYDEALTEIKRAQELDPVSLSINAWYGRILLLRGEVDAAIEILKKTVELDPNFILGRLRLGQAYAEKGMFKEAMAEFDRVLHLPGGKPLALLSIAHTQALSGNREQALPPLNEAIQLSKQQHVSGAWIAAVYTALGENDKAFQWLEAANQARDLNTIRLKHDPRYASLRSDPRFDDLVRRIGIP
jgi:eukaryotic-like serine/threonine-protein kinase